MSVADPSIFQRNGTVVTSLNNNSKEDGKQTVNYVTNKDAIRGESIFNNHTYDTNFQYSNSYTSYSSDTSDIRYFPWNDSKNYSNLCNIILKRITQNGTYYIISGSLIGGIGHKYLSVFYSLTYAILLGRRFLSIDDDGSDNR